MTGTTRHAPVVLSWSEAHRMAGVEQLVPPAEHRRAPSVTVGPGPVAYVDGPGHGAGALRQLAETLAAGLGVGAVAIRAPEVDLLGGVGAALAIASDEEAIALTEALTDGRLRRRPVLAVAPGAVRNYFSRARLGRRRIVCGVDHGDPSRRALAVADELAERLGADVEVVDVGPALRHAVATTGASLVVVGGGPVVGAPVRELIERAGVPVLLA
jgi:hypothetical protein